MEDKKNLKSVIEKETPGGRLQSLKLPRDLSLGITKSKKQYTPNLNVIRNKDKTKEFLNKRDQKRKDKTSHKERHNKQDNKQRYQQSIGVFSQGTGEVKRLNAYTEKRVSFRDNSTVSNMVLPTINRNTWTVNKKAEDVVLEELLNCDIDSDDEKMSFAPLTLSSDPIKKVKKETINIKKEENSTFKTEFLPEPFSNDDIYNEENPSLSLVKLPDSFAGKGLSDDPNVKELFDYPLSGMLEGKIGKMVIRRSGKVEVYIGRIKYELTTANTVNTKEELATITKGHNGETCIAVLGHILNSFIMFPDYDALLKKK
ncbi:RNA pol Rpc4 domain containing protein [Asbolus verrucosus]|uniref:RNA pol Rpc4 domain containing protein n=1 Tax=Asbolus verrucosus TaxID=1661398 RepID=A0A482VPH3_ASBVE|nr:RNA pol Rpc4 domain containing protein [Asbolus verrucosus]